MRSGLQRNSLFKLIIFIPLTSMAFPITSNGNEPEMIKINLSDGVSKARNFTCREPQPRAYILKDLITDGGNYPNQPIYIVLKRCDEHSGCCSSSEKSCSPDKPSIYYEKMEIEMFSFTKKAYVKRLIKVEQHGNCSCDSTTTEKRQQMKDRQPKVVLL